MGKKERDYIVKYNNMVGFLLKTIHVESFHSQVNLPNLRHKAKNQI